MRLTLERVAAARARAAFGRRVVQGLALIAVIVTSPWLIAGSVQISAAFNECLQLVSGWLATPQGMTAAVLSAIVVAAMYRWQAWRRAGVGPRPTAGL